MRGLLLTACVASCVPAEDGQSSVVDRVPPGPGGSVTAPSPPVGRWTRESSGGARITLSVDPFPVVAGPVRFTIEELPGDEGGATPTLDVVSPTMPAHGVVRFPAVRRGDDWVVDAEIPMEGQWIAYFNLDFGADAAAFSLDVGPGAAGGHQHGAVESEVSSSQGSHPHEVGGHVESAPDAAHAHSGGSE